MLLSLALMFLCGLGFGKVFDYLKLPRLIGMMLTGLILGPFVLNLLDEKILIISGDLRQLALVIILIRAGLNLDIQDLQQVGRPAVLLSFIPALFEILGVTLFASVLFKFSWIDGVLLGCVLAAVSPAIIVPRMLKLKEKRLGVNKLIPQLVMAGASMDDVFVIVLFTSFLSLSLTGQTSPLIWMQLPMSIGLGLLGGFVIGNLLSWWFTRFHIRDTGKVMIILSTAFIFIYLESMKSSFFSFSALISIMMMAAMIQIKKEHVAKRLSHKFSKLWHASEVLLFVLVGAQVSWNSVMNIGLYAVILILGALVFRACGVVLSLFKTPYNTKEKMFIVFSYIPKATIQAAIGGIALGLNHPQGSLILTLAVLSILISAPLGAWLIDHSASTLLSYEVE
jgi:solute carrier family 9B (sodium/hydrogen exchanger), member 1/2